MKKNKTNYNLKSLDNLVQNNKNLSTEEREQIKKDSAKMRIKSYKWKLVFNVPVGSDLSDKICEESDVLHKLESYGFDYYCICHDRDFYINENNEKIIKTKHYHIVLVDRVYKLNTTTKSMLNFVSSLFGLPLECISIEPSYRVESDVAYLIHALDSDKVQYVREEIITNRRANCNYIIFRCIDSCKDKIKIDDIEYKDLAYYIYNFNCSFRDLVYLLSKGFIQRNAYVINCLIAESRSEIYKALQAHNKQEEIYKHFDDYYLSTILKGSKKKQY